MLSNSSIHSSLCIRNFVKIYYQRRCILFSRWVLKIVFAIACIVQLFFFSCKYDSKDLCIWSCEESTSVNCCMAEFYKYKTLDSAVAFTWFRIFHKQEGFYFTLLLFDSVRYLIFLNYETKLTKTLLWCSINYTYVILHL